MAPFAQLSDDFADNAIARAWTTNTSGSGSVSEASGRATCALPNSTAGSHIAYYKSTYAYDLTGDAAAITINGMVATGVACIATFELWKDASNIYYWQQGSGTLTARKLVGGVDTQLYSASWNATTYKYLRIRESAGTVYFDSSSNGTSWTNRATQTVAGAFAVTSLYVQFGAYCGNVASPGSLTIEDFNLLSLSTTWRWAEGSRAYQHRIGSVSIAATGGVGYIAVAASKDASGNLVSPVYYSGPLMDGRELTKQASQAAAQAMAARLPSDGVWHVPPGDFVEGRYTRLYLRSHDGSSFVLREFYPRRFIQADDIEAESIRALHVAAHAITADKLSVLQLSAITADLGTVTAGTVIGATVETATSGARIELTSANGLRSYNSSNVLQVQIRTSDGALAWAGGTNQIDATGMRLEVGGAAGAAPAIRWMSSGSELHRIHGDSSGIWLTSQTTKLGISPSDYAYASTGMVVGEDRGTGGSVYAALDVHGGAYITGGGLYLGSLSLGGSIPAVGSLVAEGDSAIGTGASGGTRLLVQGGGATSATYALTAKNSSGTNLMYTRNDGALNASVVNWTITSDMNAKREIAHLDVAAGDVAGLLAALKPRRYRLNTDADDAPERFGFVAQEWQAHPLLATQVRQLEDGTLGIIYDGAIPVLAALLRRAFARIAALEAR